MDSIREMSDFVVVEECVGEDIKLELLYTEVEWLDIGDVVTAEKVVETIVF